MAYIDTSKVSIPKGFFEDLNVPKLLDWLNSQLTADVAEVKHGFWKMGIDEAGYEYGTCSVCGYKECDAFPRGDTPNYCPNCGTNMDGRRDT